MPSSSNAAIFAFLEDLNVKLKRFNEMVVEAREDITKALARLEAQQEQLASEMPKENSDAV